MNIVQAAQINVAAADASSKLHAAEPASKLAGNTGTQGSAPVVNGHHQQPSTESGKKKLFNPGRGKGIGFAPKGRGPGWTGAGFDVDGRT